MARRERQYAPGTIAHLVSVGVENEPIVRTTIDFIHLLGRVREVTKRIDWQILSWCLMTTHYHLVVVVGRNARVPWAMQLLNGLYAREFNARYRRRGHLFRERYSGTLVETDFHLEGTIPYVLENPVRAGLVKRVEDWPWSGDGRLQPRFIPATSSIPLPRPRREPHA